MTQNKGTLVGSTIRPFSPEDKYPVADTNELKGGHMQVDTIAQRDAIPMERRNELMRVSVVENERTYILKKDANGDLKNWEPEADFPVRVDNLSNETASKLSEATIAVFSAGKEYFGQVFRYFIVRTLGSGVKKFIPIGITYVSANEGGISIFDPETEQYILYKNWESLQAPSSYIHPNLHPASIIDQNENYRFVSDVEKEYWSKKANVEDISNRIADLIASSPATLDTLNEIAAALGNDPNFATTITNLIGGKANTDHAHLWENIGNRPTKLSQLSNDLGNYGGFITAISQAMVVAALGYTPYNASNPADYATTSHVAQKIAELVASSPAALDTLKELANALGGDPNFATTITNLIGGKANTDHAHLWENIGNRPTKLSQLANDLGNYGGFITAISQAMVVAALGYTPYNASNPADYATTSHVAQKIAELVASSPAALDTLNELANALGGDPNFATTITQMIAGKANVAHAHEEYNNKSYNVRQYLGAGYNGGGFEKPEWFGSGKLQLQMLSGENLGILDGWYDVLWMSSYTGGDVRGSNALIFSKNYDKVGFARQHYDSINWGSYREFFHTGNFNPADYATTSHVAQKIAELVASSPAALDTLNELANALGGDPNFATTITSLIGGKANANHAHLWESIGNRPTKLSQLTNDLGNYGSFLTAISQAMVTSALGYTPYNASNPANYATADFVRQKIAELVASSPAALDTLNELANALGGDPNFATTITNLIAGKANTNHAHSNYLPIIGTVIVDNTGTIIAKSGSISSASTAGQDSISITHNYGSTSYGVLVTCEAESAGSDFYGALVGVSAKYDNYFILQSEMFYSHNGAKVNVVVYKI